MSFASQGTHQKFPFAHQVVFDGLVAVLPKGGFKVVSADQA
jgi:hypothetical protein